MTVCSCSTGSDTPGASALVPGFLPGHGTRSKLLLRGPESRGTTAISGTTRTMNHPAPTPLDRRLAEVCRKCPVCRRARQRPTGLASWMVRRVEARFCPFCRAYERVYGRKSHEPVS